MILSRVMSMYESDINEMIENFLDLGLSTMEFKKNTSWSGENSTESFVNEWNKGVEVVIFWEDVDSKLVKKLTTDDIDEYDVLECDIYKYDEYRNIKDITLNVVDISDGREDVGYVKIELK